MAIAWGTAAQQTRIAQLEARIAELLQKGLLKPE